MSEHADNLSPSERDRADREAVAEVIEKARVAMVTTIDRDGSLVSRPLAVLDRTFDGTVHFFIPDSSEKADQVRQNPAVNVAIESRGNYLSVAGTGSITKDPAVIDEFWNAPAAAWFPEGRDDPTVALLTVRAESAELQSSDTPRALALVKYVKAMATDDEPDVGDSTRVEL